MASKGKRQKRVDWEGELVTPSEAIRRCKLLHPSYDQAAVRHWLKVNLGLDVSRDLVYVAGRGHTDWQPQRVANHHIVAAAPPPANGKPSGGIVEGLISLRSAVHALGVDGCRAALDLMEDSK